MEKWTWYTIVPGFIPGLDGNYEPAGSLVPPGLMHRAGSIHVCFVLYATPRHHISLNANRNTTPPEPPSPWTDHNLPAPFSMPHLNCYFPITCVRYCPPILGSFPNINNPRTFNANTQSLPSTCRRRYPLPSMQTSTPTLPADPPSLNTTPTPPSPLLTQGLYLFDACTFAWKIDLQFLFFYFLGWLMQQRWSRFNL